MRRKAYIGVVALAAILICAAAIIHIVRAQAFMAEAGRMAERFAAQRLGTDVHIGTVEIRSLHELTIDDIVVYDKQADVVLRADEARVTLRLLSLLLSPETSVDEVLLTGAHAHIVQRADGSWNYNDLAADDPEPSTFEGRIRLADATAEIETGERNRKSRELERAEAQRALDSVMEQGVKLSDELREDKQRLSVLESDIARQDAAFEEHEKRRAEMKDQRLAHEAESRVLDTTIKSAVTRVEAVRAKQHDCDKRLERVHLRLEDCRTGLLSDFGLTPEAAAKEAQEVEAPVLEMRLHALEESIRALGTVNPNAVEEYAEKKERYEEEEAQIADLRAAKQDIEQIIQKIDQDMTRTFREAFRQIQEYFNEIFVRLFGGGIAELRLTDKEDILSSGVEILVTLPDKKRQNLSALSGGERALTVIALLFSFLRYRPSPFSILDEIDAPLDEANVSRFGEFLQEFAKNTQFIVVTHRKGTMRAADTMYGVTVEDAGVSKVLSIRLKDYEAEQSA